MHLQYRQGDILLDQVASLPQDARPVPPDSRGRIVLALGAVTGHAHAFHSGVEMFSTPAGVDYVQIVEAGADLVHEEHAAIPVAAGTYAVRRQREFAPEADRRVED